MAGIISEGSFKGTSQENVRRGPMQSREKEGNWRRCAWRPQSLTVPSNGPQAEIKATCVYCFSLNKGDNSLSSPLPSKIETFCNILGRWLTSRFLKAGAFSPGPNVGGESQSKVCKASQDVPARSLPRQHQQRSRRERMVAPRV